MAMQQEVGRDFLTDARSNWLEMIGRLKPGTSAEAAAAALSSLLEQPAAEAAGADLRAAAQLHPLARPTRAPSRCAASWDRRFRS